MKISASFQNPVIKLSDGSIVEGTVAHLYVSEDSQTAPVFLQLIGKSVITLPWREIRVIVHD